MTQPHSAPSLNSLHRAVRRACRPKLSPWLLAGLLTGPVQAFDAVIPLSSLDGSNGFRIDGVSADDLSGIAVSSAGDINGDNLDDILIGAWGADNNGSYSGSSYVVFGAIPPIFRDGFESDPTR